MPESAYSKPLSEREMLKELKLFVENLTCDCSFIIHHTCRRHLAHECPRQYFEIAS